MTEQQHMNEEPQYPVCPFCSKAIVSAYFEGSYDGHIRVCGHIDASSSSEHIIQLLETPEEGAPLRVMVQRDRLDSVLSREDVNGEAKEQVRRYFEEKDTYLKRIFTADIMEVYGAYVERMNLLYDCAKKLDLPNQRFEAFLARDLSEPNRQTAMIRISDQFYSVIYP